MQLIDTHVHINFDVFQPDLEEVCHRWREVGVSHLVHSMVDPEEFGQIQALSQQFSELFFAVGLHPLDVHKYVGVSEASPRSAVEENEAVKQVQQRIWQLANSDSKVVAIGETGLDFYKAENQQAQIASFEAQLEVAQKFNLPVIIHCRNAATTAKEVLEKFIERNGPVRGVMHCWGGDPTETQWFLDLGFYISFSGIVTFKNAKSVQASAQMVPKHRLLVETDCPFLAPTPKRGKRNEPALVQHVAEKIAELRQESVETICQQTTENAHRLFALQPVATG